MTKSFLRAVLAGFIATGTAVAQTPPRPLTPTSSPPAPIQRVAFKQVLPAAAEAPAKFAVQVFDVADLVNPPKDSPLAKPTDDALTAALTAYRAVKAKELLSRVRATVDHHTWSDHGGTLDFYAEGNALVARNTPAVLDRVGECLASIRKLRDTQVMFEMVLVSVPSDRAEIKKLFGDKQSATLTADELKSLLHDLKKDAAVSILSQPKLMLMNKQAGFLQVGQQLRELTTCTDGKPQQVSYQHVGLVTRATPDVSADGKFIRLKLDVQHSQPGLKGCALDCQKLATTLTLPTGGTMVVKVGTRKTEQRIESKLPVLGDLPYVGRLFRSVGIRHVETNTYAVVTVKCVGKNPPAPLPIAPKPKGSFSLQLGWSAKSGPTASVTVKPAPPVVSPVQPQVMRTVGADGLEKIGVDFDFMTRPTLPLRAVGGGCGNCRDTSMSLMKSYKAACAAGRKDEAARLALQLLANDPTCFGRGE